MILLFFVQLYSLISAILYNTSSAVHLKSPHFPVYIKFSQAIDLITCSVEEGFVTLSLKPGTLYQPIPNTSTGRSELETGIILLLFYF